MRIPLSWLQEFITLSHTPKEIASLLTMAGLEVDGYETVGENLKDIIAVRVVESIKHPNADKLSIATVTDGKEAYTIVCGAPDCRKGLKTALARVGVVVGKGDEAFSIKRAKIRGIESEGMLCSELELGLSETGKGSLNCQKRCKRDHPSMNFTPTPILIFP